VTRFFDNLSGSPAARTGLRYLEKTARTNYLPATPAGWTIDRTRTWFRTAAIALVACIQLTNFNLLLCAKSGLLQGDLHIVTQIGTALPFFRATAAGTPEKALENSSAAAPKDLAENVERIVESAPETGGALRKRSVPESIVGGTLIDVDQDVVGFAEFLKFFLGVWIVRILVRVEFDRELAIGPLDFALRRASGTPSTS